MLLPIKPICPINKIRRDGTHHERQFQNQQHRHLVNFRQNGNDNY
jgi:hypothetical protein